MAFVTPRDQTRCRNVRSARRRAGFSYMEVLIATTLIALALIPALDALRGSIDSTAANETLTTEHYHAQAYLADLAAESFDDLDMAAMVAGSPNVPSRYSDAPDTPMRRLVFLSRYDFEASPPAPDPTASYGTIWMRVAIEGSAHGFEVLRVH